MQACALQEIGRHDDALELATAIADEAVSDRERLVARLIRVLVRGCRGEVDFARGELLDLIGRRGAEEEPLIGYAYRFFDIVDGLAESLPKLQTSIAWFESFGLNKSRAYSELPTAMILARLGRLSEARELIGRARSDLANEVRDQHIILNNAAAVELLADDFDAAECREILRLALRSARDDFSELTIISNLALAELAGASLGTALDCAARALEILEHHDFADQDIFWPVCFNSAKIFALAGRFGDQARALELLERNKTVSVNQPYWDYRFGLRADVPPAYDYLAARETHPLYLSHWTIELEGLSLLTEESPPRPAHSSTPSR
jgi:tetratricopeptide (TPR) repeat protein